MCLKINQSVKTAWYNNRASNSWFTLRYTVIIIYEESAVGGRWKQEWARAHNCWCCFEGAFTWGKAEVKSCGRPFFYDFPGNYGLNIFSYLPFHYVTCTWSNEDRLLRSAGELPFVSPCMLLNSSTASIQLNCKVSKLALAYKLYRFFRGFYFRWGNDR